MHPDILRQLAADHIRELTTQAGQARRAHESGVDWRHRLATYLRRSPRLAAQPAELPAMSGEAPISST